MKVPGEEDGAGWRMSECEAEWCIGCCGRMMGIFFSSPSYARTALPCACAVRAISFSVSSAFALASKRETPVAVKSKNFECITDTFTGARWKAGADRCVSGALNDPSPPPLPARPAAAPAPVLLCACACPRPAAPLLAAWASAWGWAWLAPPAVSAAMPGDTPI